MTTTRASLDEWLAQTEWVNDPDDAPWEDAMACRFTALGVYTVNLCEGCHRWRAKCEVGGYVLCGHCRRNVFLEVARCMTGRPLRYLSLPLALAAAHVYLSLQYPDHTTEPRFSTAPTPERVATILAK